MNDFHYLCHFHIQMPLILPTRASELRFQVIHSNSSICSSKSGASKEVTHHSVLYLQSQGDSNLTPHKCILQN